MVSATNITTTNPNKFPTTKDYESDSSSTYGSLTVYRPGPGDYVIPGDWPPQRFFKILQSFRYFTEEEAHENDELPAAGTDMQPSESTMGCDGKSKDLEPSSAALDVVSPHPQGEKLTYRLSLVDALLAASAVSLEFPDSQAYNSHCFASLLWALLIEPNTQKGQLCDRAGKVVSGKNPGGQTAFPLPRPHQSDIDQARRRYELLETQRDADREAAILYYLGEDVLKSMKEAKTTSNTSR